MAASPKRDFFESSRAAVNDHELRRKLESASARHLDHFAQVKAEFPSYDEERDAARPQGPRDGELVRDGASDRGDERLGSSTRA